MSRITQTFYGVEFKPGDVKEVPGYINDPHFVIRKHLPVIPPVDNKVSKTQKQTKGVDASKERSDT